MHVSPLIGVLGQVSKKKKQRPSLWRHAALILVCDLFFPPHIASSCHLITTLFIYPHTHTGYFPATPRKSAPPQALHLLSSSQPYDVCLLLVGCPHQHQKEETQPPPNPRQTRVGICGGGHPHPTQVPGGLVGCLALHRAA